MKPTEQQEKLFSCFSVMRMSVLSQKINGGLTNPECIADFCSRNRNGHQGNQNLVNYLKSEALIEDSSGEAATYLVLYKKQKLAMFFTLKCSQVYKNQIKSLEDLKQQFDDVREKINDLQQIQNHNPAYEDLDDFEEYINMSPEDREKEIKNEKDNLSRLEHKLGSYSEQTDKNTNAQAEVSYPAVELAHYCFNDSFRSEWNELASENNCSQHSLGTIVFWKFIVDKILEIRNLIGCTYLICFAADETEELSLVNHYVNFLGFENIAAEYGVIETNYIRGLPPLFQTISQLNEKKFEYFSTFNPFNDEDFMSDD